MALELDGSKTIQRGCYTLIEDNRDVPFIINTICLERIPI